MSLFRILPQFRLMHQFFFCTHTSHFHFWFYTLAGHDEWGTFTVNSCDVDVYKVLCKCNLHRNWNQIVASMIAQSRYAWHGWLFHHFKKKSCVIDCWFPDTIAKRVWMLYNVNAIYYSFFFITWWMWKWDGTVPMDDITWYNELWDGRFFLH